MLAVEDSQSQPPPPSAETELYSLAASEKKHETNSEYYFRQHCEAVRLLKTNNNRLSVDQHI